jgi:tellurite resistance protein TerC
MILEAAHAHGAHTPEVSIQMSLAVILLTLGVTAVASLAVTREGGKHAPH